MLKKLSDSIADLTATSDVIELQAAFSSAIREFDFVSFNLAWNKRHAAEFMEDPLLTTWSEADLTTYSRDGWAARDPLLRCAVEETKPFLWTARDWRVKGYPDYGDYLRTSGIYGGATIPLNQEPGQLSAMTLLSVNGAALNNQTLYAMVALTHHMLGRAQILREGIGLSKPDLRRLNSLSDRQIEILRWVANGKTNREISVIMGGTHSTIDYHLEEIRRKLGVATRVQAAAILTASDLYI